MSHAVNIGSAFKAALPIVLGYVAIGIPCGILSASIGLNVAQVFIMSVLFYSGAGQFMIPNMYLAGNPLSSIILSISLVNTRQMLYSASLSQFCQTCRARLALLFSATVTDESFGVNMQRFEAGGWSVQNATLVNLFSNASWTVCNCIGVAVGNAISVPLAVASFAMTSIFICLAFSQKLNVENCLAMACAMLGVVIAKALGLGGFAIVVGALFGVLVGFSASETRERLKADREVPHDLD